MGTVAKVEHGGRPSSDALPSEAPLTTSELAELIRSIDVQPEWLDAKGIAEYLGVDASTIYNYTGPYVVDPLPHHSFTDGGRKLFNRREVDEWLLAR
jgi:hypothetical protein